MRIRPFATALLLIPCIAAPRVAAQETSHPLDGLSASEHRTLYETIRDDDWITEDAEFLYAALEELAKAEVLAWRPGDPFTRRARVHYEDTDIVLWYTIGFHHVARPEDWPILPLEMHGFNVVPAGFFDRTPAIDLPH